MTKKPSKIYTFEELAKMTPAQIAKVKKQKLDDMADRQHRIWQDIAAIMFYQN